MGVRSDFQWLGLELEVKNGLGIAGASDFQGLGELEVRFIVFIHGPLH